MNREKWEELVSKAPFAQKLVNENMVYKTKEEQLEAVRQDGKSIAGADLTIIEWTMPENRRMRPTYAFPSLSDKKLWRTTITFDTVTTQVT